ncbi:MAG: 3-oxoacyl-ACP reductase FabG [Chitinophagales bacterium]|nr:3-oxoacyl-ACP reductase FabG [Chitinophagales bacterium]
MNKVAFITGGSRGIGKACSIELAKKGYDILLNYKNNDTAAKETKKEVEALGVACELLKMDVSDKKDIESKLTNWLDTNKDKTIEILVNNAGIKQDNLMIWLTDENWESVINTSLNSFFYITRLLIKGMVANKFGRIINMVSLSGVKGMAGQTNYAAAKGGVIAATKSLAQELGRRNITVNAVAPGFIKTDMTEDIDESNYKNHIPLKRFGEVEEVSALVGFLASKEASYITGEVINVNGGLYT